MSNHGELYIVATPIGNLSDFSMRAIETLKSADKILAEDTRHSRPLLNHFAITTPCMAFHEHNEKALLDKICDEIIQQKKYALICDSGTPLISDPGFPLVREAHARGIKIIPIPGPSAAITALSAAGLATDRFYFEGFLPAKATNRRKRLEQLSKKTNTLIFYESPHRITETVSDMLDIIGPERELVIARELTKRFETIHKASILHIKNWLAADDNQRRGEFVLILAGAEAVQETAEADLQLEKILRALLAELPLKQVVKLATNITGLKKNDIYQAALALKNKL